jgi:hypothetical protein
MRSVEHPRILETIFYNVQKVFGSSVHEDVQAYEENCTKSVATIYFEFHTIDSVPETRHNGTVNRLEDFLLIFVMNEIHMSEDILIRLDTFLKSNEEYVLLSGCESVP